NAAELAPEQPMAKPLTGRGTSQTPTCTKYAEDPIRGEEAPLVSGREGLKTLKVIEAIKRSAVMGGRVVL
ncbi:hypothetical protein PY650_35485, partial [Rhizobium calliandrae]|nr:hypothetical protein [Rhizobium calliandrae]